MDEDGEKEDPAVNRGGSVQVGRAVFPEVLSEEEWEKQMEELPHYQERMRREYEAKEEARRMSAEPHQVLLEELREIKKLVEELPGLIRRQCQE